MRYLLSLFTLACLALLTACGEGGGDDDNDGNNTANLNTWTIMVYAHADHNLSGNMIADLNEMMAVTSSANLNIVLQVDFNDADIAEMGLTGTIPPGVHRGAIKNNGFTPDMSMAEIDSDQPAELTNFITWAAAAYPATRYGLVLWDHGGQWKGFGGDTQNGTRTNTTPMSTSAISSAVNSAMLTSNIGKWDFIAFDTCLMGGAEVLTDFSALTEIFIANPEIDYGDGWDYTTTLNWLAANPASNGRALAIQEASDWSNHHLAAANASSNDKAFAMHMVYDLGFYNLFEQAFIAFSDALINANEHSLYSAVRRQTTQYSIADAKAAGDPTEFTDLGEFALKVKAGTANVALQNAAQNLIDTIGNMSLMRIVGNRKANATGISVWYPVDGQVDPATYASYQGLSLSQKAGNGWDEYLASIQTAYAAAQAAPVLTQVGTLNTAAASPATPVTVQVNITENDIIAIDSIILDTTATPNEYYILGQSEIFAPGAGPGNYNVEWDTSLVTVTDGNNIAFLGGFRESPTSAFMFSFAFYTYPGSATQQLVTLVTEQTGPNSLALVGALDGESNDLAPRAIELIAGGTLTPVHLSFTATDPADQTTWSAIGLVTANASTMTIPAGGIGALTMGFNGLATGNYWMLTQAEDTYGNESAVLANTISVQ